MGILGVPLPGPPGRRERYEVYEAVGVGRATLASTLVCADGSTSGHWSVTMAVGGSKASGR